MPAASDLVDNFDDNSKNTSLWVDPVVDWPFWLGAFSGVGGSVSETGQKLSITGATSQTDRGNGYYSVGEDYDLRDSFFRIDVDTVATLNGVQSTGFKFGIANQGEPTESAGFTVAYNGSLGTWGLSCDYNAFGNPGDSPWTIREWNTTTERRLRMRHDTTVGGGTFYWEAASLGSDSWTVLRSLASSDSAYWLPSLCAVGVGVISSSVSTTSPGTWIFDNFNASAASGSTPGSGLASKTAPIKSLVNGGLVASARRPGIVIPNRKIIVPRRAPLHLGRNFHSEARL